MEIFQMKTKPHGIERKDLFISNGFVCIGYPGIGDLAHTDREEIRERLQQTYGWADRALSTHLGSVNAFVNTMMPEDIILINDNDWVHLGKLGAYVYDAASEPDGMCHRRAVQWLSTAEKFRFNEHVRDLLRNPSIVTKFKHPVEIAELDNILANHWPLTSGQPIDAALAQQALAVLKAALQSDDEETRVDAAVGILAYLK